MSEDDHLGYVCSGQRSRVVDPRAATLRTPAFVLINPKYPHNVGMALRVASAYGVRQVWYTGDRVPIEAKADYRLPREERMRGYKDVDLFQYDRPLDVIGGANRTPIAVEVRRNAESLETFDHPLDAVYVFGPEDGSIPQHILALCHRFVVIPTLHCLNLGTAVATVAYARGVQHGFVGGYSERYGEVEA